MDERNQVRFELMAQRFHTVTHSELTLLECRFAPCTQHKEWLAEAGVKLYQEETRAFYQK